MKVSFMIVARGHIYSIDIQMKEPVILLMQVQLQMSQMAASSLKQKRKRIQELEQEVLRTQLPSLVRPTHAV